MIKSVDTKTPMVRVGTAAALGGVAGSFVKLTEKQSEKAVNRLVKNTFKVNLPKQKYAGSIFMEKVDGFFENVSNVTANAKETGLSNIAKRFGLKNGTAQNIVDELTQKTDKFMGKYKKTMNAGNWKIGLLAGAAVGLVLAHISTKKSTNDKTQNV